MTDTPDTPDSDKVAPLFPNRPSAAGVSTQQPDVEALLERVAQDIAQGKAIGLMVILYSRDGSAASNSAGAITLANGIAQLELFKTQLMLQALLPPGRPQK